MERPSASSRQACESGHKPGPSLLGTKSAGHTSLARRLQHPQESRRAPRKTTAQQTRQRHSRWKRHLAPDFWQTGRPEQWEPRAWPRHQRALRQGNGSDTPSVLRPDLPHRGPKPRHGKSRASPANPVFAGGRCTAFDASHATYLDFQRHTHEGLGSLLAARVDVYPVDGPLARHLKFAGLHARLRRIPDAAALIARMDRPRLDPASSHHFVRAQA
jgi:hypothetical protein